MSMNKVDIGAGLLKHGTLIFHDPRTFNTPYVDPRMDRHCSAKEVAPRRALFRTLVSPTPSPILLSSFSCLYGYSLASCE